MRKSQLTVLLTGVVVVLASVLEERPSPVMVKVLTRSAKAALSAAETEAPPVVVAVWKA